MLSPASLPGLQLCRSVNACLYRVSACTDGFRDAIHARICATLLQRELALYTYHNLDRPFTTYFLDKDISPVFKGVFRDCGLVVIDSAA